jgi:PmbA protein
VRNSAVEEISRSEGDDSVLRVFVGNKTASISTNTLDDLPALAQRAVAMAKVAPDDVYAGLASSDQLATTFADLDLLDPTQPTTEELTDTARAAEQAALEVEGVRNSMGATSGWSLAGLVLATSNGFCQGYLRSGNSISAAVIAGEGTGMERDYDFSSMVYRSDLAAPEDIGHQAGVRAVRRLNPQKIKTTSLPVIFDRRVASSLVGHFLGAINGAGIARGTSFLKDKMGQQLFAADIEISDNPLLARGMASRPFDGEGTSPQQKLLIDSGVLQTWLLDIASARELGLSPNGSAARGGGNPSPTSTNVRLSNGKSTRDDMISAQSRALLITDLIGHGVNGVTGDYSRGAAGFMIENGEIAYPVSEITLAGNLLEMFPKMVAANDREEKRSVESPSILIDQMTIAGK